MGGVGGEYNQNLLDGILKELIKYCITYLIVYNLSNQQVFLSEVWVGKVLVTAGGSWN